MEPALFGDLLKRLRLERGFTPQSLAKAIGVDPSMVYRWERNASVPKISRAPDDVDRIAEMLKLDPRTAERLRQAQIRSHREPPAPRPKRPKPPRSDIGQQILERVGPPKSAGAPSRVGFLTSTPEPHTAPDALARRAQLARTAITLLEEAAKRDPVDDHPIQISMQGKILFEDLPGEASKLRTEWQNALRSALKRGWEVEQLWRLDRNIDRTLNLVVMMLDLVGSPRYRPRFFERVGALRPPHDVIVVPGVAALLLLAGTSQEYVDEYIILTAPTDIASVAAYFRQMSDVTRPSLRGFEERNQEVEFTRALVASEEKPGGRKLVKLGLTAVSYPEPFFDEGSAWAMKMFVTGLVSPNDRVEYLSLLRRRRQAFLKYVHDDDYRDICPRSALDALATNGDYPPDAPPSGLRWPVELRLAQMESLRDLLRDYPRYQLALLSEDEVRRISPEPTYVINGGDTAFIRTWSRDSSGERVVINLEVAEPRLVEALATHFDEQWEQIAELHRDKDYVIKYIDRLIAGLRQEQLEPQQA